MKRSRLKLVRKEMEKANRKRPVMLEPVPVELWPLHGDEKIIEVWMSNRYLVQVFDEGNEVLRVSMCRTSLNDRGEWQDNLTWDELMEVKRQIGKAAAYAVEVLPPDIDIVNVANMRHFWIMPVPFVGWKNSEVAA